MKTNFRLNVRERLKEKMKRRKISTEYLFEEDIKKAIDDINENIDKYIDKEIDYVIELISKKCKKGKLEGEDKKKVTSLLLAGRTSEEIHQLDEFKSYPIEEIEKLEKRFATDILAIQLMPIEEIARIKGIKKCDVYDLMTKHKVDGKDIVKIRKEKEEEVIRRLERGDSVEEIVNDKELNICETGAKALEKEVERKSNSAKQITKKAVSKEDRKSVLSLLLQGKAIEEIRTMQEYSAIPDEILRQIYDSNQMRIMAVRLVPINEIVERMGKLYSTVYTNINKFDYDGKTLKEIKEQKLYQIRTRLARGESIDILAQDRELNVCREVLEQEQGKILERSKTTNKTVNASQQDVQKIKKSANSESIQETKETISSTSTQETKKYASGTLVKKGTIKSAENQGQKSNLSQKDDSNKKNSKNEDINSKVTKRATDIINENSQGTKPISKLDIMRKKYKAKYNNESSKSSKKQTLTPEENEKINKILVEMLEAVNLCDGKKASSRTLIKSILNNAGLVSGKSVNLDQARQLMSIVESGKIDVSLKYFSREVAEKIKKIRKSAHSTLADAVEAEVDDVSDMSELESLSRMLNADMEKGNYHVQNAKSRIQRRIDKIRLEQRMKSLREDIPDDIKAIIEGIAKGELDIAAAKSVIAEKAAERVRGKKATRFTLTEEQERRQYLAMIRKALNEQGSKYPIERPEKTIELLEQLTDDTSLTNLNTVIANQTSRKKFDEAQDLCKEYISKSKDNMEDIAYLNSVRKRIRNEKIGDLVYRTIHSDISAEDEKKFWDLLQQGLSMGNVKMSNINIGRTQDGLRNITLQDIWPDEENEIKK